MAGFIVLDTWTRNCDRHAPARHGQPARINRNNVFLSREGAPEGLFRLVAIDHTHTFTCGRPLTAAIAAIDCIKDDVIYGLFPEFLKSIRRSELMDAVARLVAVSDSDIDRIISAVPRAWQLPADVRDALRRFLGGRRDYLGVRQNSSKWKSQLVFLGHGD